MVNKLLLVLASAGFVFSAAFAGPPPLPLEFDVNVTNWPVQQPFCPCFSQNDLDEVLGTGTSIADECEDERDQYYEQANTNIRIGTTYALVIENETLDQWDCSLYDNSPGAVVILRDIGVTNAMACRALIINSPQWARCPE